MQLTDESICDSCRARLGTKLFVMYPDDSVVCYRVCQLEQFLLFGLQLTSLHESLTWLVVTQMRTLDWSPKCIVDESVHMKTVCSVNHMINLVVFSNMYMDICRFTWLPSCPFNNQLELFELVCCFAGVFVKNKTLALR